MDFIFSVILIAFTLPLFLSISLILLITQKEILFIQKRPGLNGKSFTVFKFKTMRDESHHEKIAPEDKRITVFGMFLRRTNLDELPQLFNVLLGSMSLIGPRPLLQDYLPLYTDEQRGRHLVKPGITGWAQINGGNNISWHKKLDFDVEYTKKLSLAFDIKILIITLFRILTFRGFDTGNFIPPRFTGASQDNNWTELKNKNR